MMKIGIYKPFKKVFFYDDSEDTAAWSYEVTHLAKIFAKNGHEVHMLSETDYDDKLPGIKVGDKHEEYDRIIIFSGVFEKDKHPNIIRQLRKHTDQLDFYFTDLRLAPKHDMELFDNVYTQSTRMNKFGGVSELLCFGHEWRKLEEMIQKKDIHYYFGGTERGRLKDYLEYVYRPNCLITGKSDTLGFDNRVPRNVYMNLLDRTKYSVVIADVDYNESGFITPRHYENIMHDIISFVDAKWDVDEKIVKHSDWRRVHNYAELLEKMKELDKNPQKYISLLKSQREEIKETFISGDYTYNLLR